MQFQMKSTIQSILLVACVATTMLLCTGCPVGLEYPLGDAGKEKIDKRLLGTWVVQTADAEMKKLTVTKKDDHTYRVQVLERGEMYAMETDWFDAWVTKFEGQTFVIGKPDDENDQKYYHYQYAIEDGKLVTHDMSLLEGGMDAVTSQEALRSEVKASMKKPDFLSSKQEYTKQ
jgi:hypothetical protein